VTDVEQQREWLALLEAELGRRVARTEWAVGEGDRAREAFAAELREMARRLAMTADRYPLDPADNVAGGNARRQHLLAKAHPPGGFAERGPDLG
jgi:hypothetical protein